jgi:hypothetical protein
MACTALLYPHTVAPDSSLRVTSEGQACGDRHAGVMVLTNMLDVSQ